jgi:hypothetical protein
MTIPVIVISVNPERFKLFLQNNSWAKRVNLVKVDGIHPISTQGTPDLVDLNAFEYIHRRTMLPGELGCVLSHYLCYLRIIEDRVPWSLILEDNAVISEVDFLLIVSYFNSLESIHSKYPILLLFPQEFARRGFPSRLVAERKLRLKRSIVIPRIAKGYIVNFALAELAASNTFPIRDVADWPQWIHRCRVYATPANLLTIDRILGTDIGFRQTLQKPEIFSRFLAILKMVTMIEYILYIRNTGRNDYLKHIVINRGMRYLMLVKDLFLKFCFASKNRDTQSI